MELLAGAGLVGVGKIRGLWDESRFDAGQQHDQFQHATCAQGMAQMAAASGMRDAAEALVVAGTSSIADAADKLSKAEALDTTADELDKKVT